VTFTSEQAYYGEEQAFYVLDNGAANYLFGRQPMVSSRAWQRHGCYKVGSAQYFNMPLQKALLGCEDDWNSLDHFDPTSPPRRLMSRFNQLRTLYPSLQDGFNLVQWGNKTYHIQLPGSNNTATEMGLWYVSRSALPAVQNFTGPMSEQVWLMYTNENKTVDYTFDCQGADWIVSPYVSGTTVRNLFAPYETYTLQDSLRPFNNDGKAPYQGCLPSVTFAPLSFKALVPVNVWTGPSPMMTKFIPGHDARLLAEDGTANATTVNIAFQFNMEMNCDAITNGLTLNISSPDTGLVPRVQEGSVQCGPVDGVGSTYLVGDVSSAWQWSGKLVNVSDGVLELTLDRVSNANNSDTTRAKDRLLIRKGSSRNVMVFPNNDYDDDSFGFDNGDYTFTHQAKGADLFRYSWNFGKNYSQWTAWENVTHIPKDVFDNSGNWWEGQHIIVQCECQYFL
jgi:alpha-1,3-glucan synthase